MIEEAEVRAILGRLTRDVEPIYDQGPPTDTAVQSLATLINEAWVREMDEVKRIVTRSAAKIDRTLTEVLRILDEQADGYPDRVRRLLTGDEWIEEGPRTH